MSHTFGKSVASALFGACSAVSQHAVWAAAGDLDTTFGSQGIVVTSLAPEQVRVGKTAVQADGKIVAAGQKQAADGSQDWLLVRYNADGSIDTGFGQQGRVTTDFGSGQENALALQLLSDGKILVSGTSILDASAGAFGRYVVARYNGDGSLDESFGTGGKVSVPFENTDYANASGLLLLPNGQYLLTGMMHYNQPNNSTADPDADVMLVKLNPNGNIDAGFGQDGAAFALFGLALEIATDAELQADGKILVSGYQDQGNKIVGFVARFNGDGSVDESFGASGLASMDFNVEGVYTNALTLQSDGKILIAGSFGDTQTVSCFAGRLNADGSPDLSFGSEGYVFVADGRRESCQDVAVGNGKILLAGRNGSTQQVMTITRLNADGSLDPYFSGDGRQQIAFGNGTMAGGTAMAFADGITLLTAGNLTDSDGYQKASLVKIDLSDYGNAELACLFAWAEQYYPSFVSPAGGQTQVLVPYLYRHYAASNAYLGASSADNHLYYFNSVGLLDLGAVGDWLSLANCW